MALAKVGEKIPFKKKVGNKKFWDDMEKDMLAESAKKALEKKKKKQQKKETGYAPKYSR